jgi:hypothetical protein
MHFLLRRCIAAGAFLGAAAALLSGCSAAPSEDERAAEMFTPAVCALWAEPMPTPDPFVAAGLTGCRPINQWVRLDPSAAGAFTTDLMEWVCDKPAPGVKVPTSIWPDGWHGAPARAFGIVMSADGIHPPCAFEDAANHYGVDDANMCEVYKQPAKCTAQPPVGSVAVALAVQRPSYCQVRSQCILGNPGTCSGLCRDP